MSNERGFTFIEVLVATVMVGILATLSAGALRSFWQARSLTSTTSEVISQLRQAQSSAQSRSLPRVYGVRFTVGTGDWAFVQYDPEDEVGPCLQYTERTMPTGVVVSAASFDGSTVTDICTGSGGLRNMSGTTLPTGAADRFVFFFPRGDATAGTVTVTQPARDFSNTITVTAMTGRVEQIENPAEEESPPEGEEGAG